MNQVEDHENIKIIKGEILNQHDSIASFCRDKKFRLATILDFLNRNQSIRASKLFEVMDALNITMAISVE